MSALTDIDLLPPDVNIGQTGHEKWHDYIHSGLIAVKNLLVTLDDAAVKKTGDQSIDGNKTFTSPVTGGTPTQNAHLTTKLYVDQGLSGKTNTGHTHVIANITSLQSTLDGKLSLTGGTLSGDITSSGSAGFSGTFNETTTNAGVYVGKKTADSPRILFANGTAAQNWQIDNNSGQFRWFLPGAVQMGLTGTALDVYNKPINNVTNPTTAQQAATKSYVDTADALKANTANPTFTGDVLTNGTKLVFNPQAVKASIITEAASTIIDVGSNYFQAGSRVASSRGAYFRMDTRDSNAHELFSITTQEAGVVSDTAATGELKLLFLSNTGILNTTNQIRTNATAPVAANDLTRKDYVDTTLANALSTGVVKTTTDQTIAGVKTFTSAPKLKTTSTAGYAWVATGTDGSGDWSAIVNAPGGTVPWANITGRPTTFTPEAHVHAITDVTNLSSTLSGKVDTTRTVSAGTGLTGGGDLSANRTFAVVYGTTASSAAQGNDSRLSDTRIPTDLSVTTGKIADANITLPKLATTARPYDICYVQSLDTRAVGYGEMVYGIRVSKAIVITSIRYRMGTADASGTTTCQLYSSATAAAANTAIANTSGTAAIDPTAVTGAISIAAGTYLYVYTSAIGTTPGKGLVADIEAYLA